MRDMMNAYHILCDISIRHTDESITLKFGGKSDRSYFEAVAARCSRYDVYSEPGLFLMSSSLLGIAQTMCVAHCTVDFGPAQLLGIMPVRHKNTNFPTIITRISAITMRFITNDDDGDAKISRIKYIINEILLVRRHLV